MTDKQPVIHWFRRDLRLTDNTALINAMQSEQSVVPLFVFDPALLNSSNVGAPRMKFMLAGLEALAEKISSHRGKLIIRHGKPADVIPAIVEEMDAAALYFNKDYTPYAKQRDENISDALSIPVHSFHDALIMPPGDVMTNKGDPYTVYTPFKKKWRSKSQQSDLKVIEDLPGNFSNADIDTHGIPSLTDLDFPEIYDIPPAGENIAKQRLAEFLHGPVYDYDKTRNELALHPFEGSPGTSQLSPYFRMGMLSPRQAVSAARDAYRRARTDSSKESVTTWIDEIIWREFYMHIMAHFPHVASGNFRADYDNLEWEDNEDALQAWKDGKTGYPIVDAAMRQLKATGWMPNRARMIVASFLTKDLLIHWQHGEQHFMKHLIDGDPAANNGGWQWAAGTGTDAQPYFRIFNPTTQGQRYDPDGRYIRTWVPELANVYGDATHEPSRLDKLPDGYPPPIVNHKDARARTLSAFKRARGETNS